MVHPKSPNGPQKFGSPEYVEDFLPYFQPLCFGDLGPGEFIDEPNDTSNLSSVSFGACSRVDKPGLQPSHE